jgi:hypothetical protein
LKENGKMQVVKVWRDVEKKGKERKMEVKMRLMFIASGGGEEKQSKSWWPVRTCSCSGSGKLELQTQGTGYCWPGTACVKKRC